MRILRGLAHLTEEIPGSFLTIGNFDGVHLGHRAILQQIVQRAQAVRGTSVVLTFDPHPLRVLRPDQAPPLITTLEEKMKLLDELGIQVAISLPFTPEFAALSARQFVEEVLLKKIGLRELYVGYDFAFGRGREGTLTCLREMGAQWGFEVKTVGSVSLKDRVVSSSLIRRLIQQGEVREAARLLGRPYSLKGVSGQVEKVHVHLPLRPLCGQPIISCPPPEATTGCGEPFWMADCRPPLDPEMEVKDVPAARLLPQKDLLPPPGLYAVQILHRPGISPAEADLIHLCQIPASQGQGPPWLDLWEVPGGADGETWEIAFLQRLRHWNEGVAAGWSDGNGGGRSFLDEGGGNGN